MSRLLTWLREPLLHFVGIGLLLFLGYRVLHPKADEREESTRIEITADDLRQLELGWRSQGRPAPTPEELRHLVESRIREEILYREALALGLEQGDTIVKRRLAQKMEFLFEDVAALREPTPEELGAWYEQHLGQLAFIGVVLAVMVPLWRLVRTPAAEHRALRGASYAIGSIAAFWLFERLTAFPG